MDTTARPKGVRYSEVSLYKVDKRLTDSTTANQLKLKFQYNYSDNKK